MFWLGGMGSCIELCNERGMLSRYLRFHSSDLLGYVHRAQAIKEWAKMINRQEISLEKALSAFDMFVLQGRKGDFDEVRSASLL